MDAGVTEGPLHPRDHTLQPHHTWEQAEHKVLAYHFPSLRGSLEDELTVFFIAFFKCRVVEAGVVGPCRSIAAGGGGARVRRRRAFSQVCLRGVRRHGRGGHHGSLIAALTSWPVHSCLLTPSPRTPFTKKQVCYAIRFLYL